MCITETNKKQAVQMCLRLNLLSHRAFEVVSGCKWNNNKSNTHTHKKNTVVQEYYAIFDGLRCACNICKNKCIGKKTLTQKSQM